MPFMSTSGSQITWYLIFLLVTAALGPFQFGYHLAELNTPQAVITCELGDIDRAAQVQENDCIPMSVDQFALVTSIFTLGGLLGALISGPYCAAHGRLRAMRLLTISFIIGPIFEACATNVALLALGRLISGLGAGAAVVVAPIYISEISPPNQRGLFGALTQIMTNVGILLTQILGFYFSYGSMWRIVLAAAGGVALAQLLALSFAAESPKWLAENRDLTEAKLILRKMRGSSVDLNVEIRSWDITSRSRRHSEDDSLLPESQPDPSPSGTSGKLGIMAVALDSRYRPAIIAVVIVMLSQQFTGINTIVMYSVHLLTALLPTSAALLSVGISALNLVMTSICAPLPDKFGRKPCIVASILGMGLSSILLAVSMAHRAQLLGASATLLFVASFAVGLGPVPFILANELVGPEAVGATQSWALGANWTATFIVSQFFPMLNSAMGEQGRIYFVFAALAAVSVLLIIWCVPETRGRCGMDEVWGIRRIALDDDAVAHDEM